MSGESIAFQRVARRTKNNRLVLGGLLLTKIICDEIGWSGGCSFPHQPMLTRGSKNREGPYNTCRVFRSSVSRHFKVLYNKGSPGLWPVLADNPSVQLQIYIYITCMYCIVLYCIVLYCIVLYCIVLYCIVLYCIVLYMYVYVYTYVYMRIYRCIDITNCNLRTWIQVISIQFLH